MGVALTESMNVSTRGLASDTARAERTTRTERYVLGMPLLADYLAEGLEAFGIDPEEAEEDALES